VHNNEGKLGVPKRLIFRDEVPKEDECAVLGQSSSGRNTEVLAGSFGIEGNVAHGADQTDKEEDVEGILQMGAGNDIVVNVDMEVDENVRALPGEGVLVVSAQENPTVVGLNCRDGNEVGAHVGVLDAPRKRLIFKRRPRTDVEKVSSEQAVEVNKKRQMSGPEGDVQEGRKRLRESEGVEDTGSLEESYTELAGLPEQSRWKK